MAKYLHASAVDGDRKLLPASPAETNVPIDQIELNPKNCHPLERERLEARAESYAVRIAGGDIVPLVDLVHCVPESSAGASLACVADLAWVLAQARGGARTIRARIWSDGQELLERKTWKDRVEPAKWNNWEQSAYVAGLLDLRDGSAVDEEQEKANQKEIAQIIGKSASVVCNLVCLARFDQNFLRLLDLDDVRQDDGARMRAALLQDERAFVQRAIIVAGLQGRGVEFAIEMAVALLRNR